MRSIGIKLAALLLGLGLLGGDALAVAATVGSAGAPMPSRAVIQTARSTPAAATPGVDPQCRDDENGAEEADDNKQQGQAEGTSEDEDGAENGHEENGTNEENGEEDDNGTGEAATNAQPGMLTEGQDLLPRAKITVEQAIQAARASAQGTLGTVELEQRNGTLVFEVTIGAQEVFVDATTGTVASVEPVATSNHENEGSCDDGQGAADD